MSSIEALQIEPVKSSESNITMAEKDVHEQGYELQTSQRKLANKKATSSSGVTNSDNPQKVNVAGKGIPVKARESNADISQAVENDPCLRDDETGKTSTSSIMESFEPLKQDLPDQNGDSLVRRINGTCKEAENCGLSESETMAEDISNSCRIKDEEKLSQPINSDNRSEFGAISPNLDDQKMEDKTNFRNSPLIKLTEIKCDEDNRNSLRMELPQKVTSLQPVENNISEQTNCVPKLAQNEDPILEIEGTSEQVDISVQIKNVPNPNKEKNSHKYESAESEKPDVLLQNNDPLLGNKLVTMKQSPELERANPDSSVRSNSHVLENKERKTFDENPFIEEGTEFELPISNLQRIYSKESTQKWSNQKPAMEDIVNLRSSNLGEDDVRLSNDIDCRKVCDSKSSPDESSAVNVATATENVENMTKHVGQLEGGREISLARKSGTAPRSNIERVEDMRQFDPTIRTPLNKNDSSLSIGEAVHDMKYIGRTIRAGQVDPSAMFSGPQMHQGVQQGHQMSQFNQQFNSQDNYLQHMPPAFMPTQNQHQRGFYHPVPVQPPPQMMMGTSRRRIVLKLQEDVLQSTAKSQRPRRGFFFRGYSARKVGKKTNVVGSDDIDALKMTNPNRGTVTVSWFEGTTTSELRDHVRKRVLRKLNLREDTELAEMRLIDESAKPPEEICLSPYIPDGAQLLLRYTTKQKSEPASPLLINDYGPPDSPSAAPSPYSSSHDLALNTSQLNLLRKQLDELNTPEARQVRHKPRFERMNSNSEYDSKQGSPEQRKTPDFLRKDSAAGSEATFVPQQEDPIEARLRQITEILLLDREAKQQHPPPVQKKQVVFVLANYFVLFLSLIAIMAELQDRAPEWLTFVEKQLVNVQTCATDQDTLFQCVSNGDFAGLMASVVLWLSRSAATKRFFLFGFETPKKLWNVVYESLVSALCWGFSYMFIRRGMNPDTRQNFLHKYWKDAVYGSLAGFNAAFLKQVLKNLIPQEALEDVINERQLKILSWLPSFS